MPTLQSLVIPFALAALLAVRGLRHRSLSPSGATTAFIVGFLLLSVPLRVFGVTMIVFYLAGSRVTKVGHSVKKTLSEEGKEEAGYRNAEQVLSNSFNAVAAGTLWALLLYPDSIHSILAWPFLDSPIDVVPSSYFSDTWCPSPYSTILPPNTFSPKLISRILIFAMLGHFACCCGDTFASELGILADSPPRLVTAPWRSVPPGTNGGMSALGTFGSYIGGVLIGVTVAVDMWIEGASCLLGNDSPILQIVKLGMLGGLGGVLGSLIDSLLGAVAQRSVYSKESKMVLKDGTVAPGSTVISGFDLLSNNQVNFVASAATAVIFGAAALSGVF